MLFFVLFYLFFIKNRPHAAIKESNNSSRGMFFFFFLIYRFFFSSLLYSSADVTMSFGFAFLCSDSLCAPCYCCVSCSNPYLLWTQLPNNSVYSVTISVPTDSWPSPFKYEKVLGLNKSSPCKELTRRSWDCFCLCFLLLSWLPQQREHSEQRLEDPQHGQEQVVRLHGQDPGGEAGVAGGHHEREGTQEK